MLFLFLPFLCIQHYGCTDEQLTHQTPNIALNSVSLKYSIMYLLHFLTEASSGAKHLQGVLTLLLQQQGI